MYTLLRTLRFHDNNQEKNSAVLRNPKEFSSQVIGWQLRLYRIVFFGGSLVTKRGAVTSVCISVISKNVLGDDIQPCDNPRRHRVVACDGGGRFGFPRPLPPDPHNTLV